MVWLEEAKEWECEGVGGVDDGLSGAELLGCSQEKGLTRLGLEQENGSLLWAELSCGWN